MSIPMFYLNSTFSIELFFFVFFWKKIPQRIASEKRKNGFLQLIFFLLSVFKSGMSPSGQVRARGINVNPLLLDPPISFTTFKHNIFIIKGYKILEQNMDMQFFLSNK